MGVSIETSQWLPTTIFTFTVAAITAYYVLGKKWKILESKVQELEKSLKTSLDKCASERQGRIRAQQELRKALLEQKMDTSMPASYPMMPIGTVQSCFSTRNGTPRQPLLVPLARACLMFDPVRVPPASLEGLEEYSHIWIIYVFHLNTDLDKLWLEPSRSKIKAKVRVPRLKGGKKGVFATRTPHRPSPIGLTVAKVEAVHENMILLSGVDLVEGTPVLDVKPYLSYCDSVGESVVPDWVKDDGLITVASITFSEGFHSALAASWEVMEKCSLYSSPDEMTKLIKQVLSWDIRSSSQRHRPHQSLPTVGNLEQADISGNAEGCEDDEAFTFVFDLSDVKPNEFVQYGLACLEQLASVGDPCAKEIRDKLRVVVAGGDGTVGWVLGSLGELHKAGRTPVPAVSIIPLGTGNDLSRSFGWGGSFPFAWKSAVKRSLHKASIGPICRLDSWHASITMPAGEVMDLPHSLKSTGECTLDQEFLLAGRLPEKVTCYDGVFYNYFSIGMDAQVAYGFHNLRNEKPYLAQGPIANKLIYSGYSCTQGWFFTPCASDPSLRGLNNILRIHIKKINSSEWEQIRVPSNVRSIVALNLHSYASGRHPWGNLSPDYLEKKGFVEANADDGLLEVFGLKHGWHASFVMVELISAKHIAQAAAIRFEVRGGEWRQSFMQMDGEPWKQPLDKEYSTFVEIKRVPFHSLMIRGE